MVGNNNYIPYNIHYLTSKLRNFNFEYLTTYTKKV